MRTIPIPFSPTSAMILPSRTSAPSALGTAAFFVFYSLRAGFLSHHPSARTILTKVFVKSLQSCHNDQLSM
jgi:hypothetical protein